MKERRPTEHQPQLAFRTDGAGKTFPGRGEVEVTVILPTYNEAQNIVPLINRVHTALQGINNEIVVVDDDSPDRTWEIAQAIQNKGVRVIRRIENRGLVQSIRCGIENALGHDVVWLDADQSMPPEVIPHLVTELKKHHISIGSRYVKGGKDLRPATRVITSRMINIAANLVLNFKVLDWTSGFVAARKEVFQTMQLKNSVYGEYCIDFLYTAGRKGFRIKEIPYIFVDRLEGESKTAARFSSLLRFGWVYGKKVLSLRFSR